MRVYFLAKSKLAGKLFTTDVLIATHKIVLQLSSNADVDNDNEYNMIRQFPGDSFSTAM